jgi:hypothetical protein
MLSDLDGLADGRKSAEEGFAHSRSRTGLQPSCCNDSCVVISDFVLGDWFENWLNGKPSRAVQQRPSLSDYLRIA